MAAAHEGEDRQGVLDRDGPSQDEELERKEILPKER